MRLGMRLFVGVFLIVGIAAFFVMRVFVGEVKPGVRQAMESSLVDTANVLAQLATDDLRNGRIANGSFARQVDAAMHRRVGANVWSFRKDQVDYRIYVTDAQGIVRYDSAGVAVGRNYARWNDVDRTLHGRYGARSSPDPGADANDTVMHVAAPILDPAGRIIGSLTVANPNRTTEPFIRSSQREIMRNGGILLALSAVIGLAMTLWLARGISRLNAYATAVSAGERVRPPTPRNDELGDLGRALEIMRSKLDGKEYVERYVQSLTHEMKGPLAGIRAASELLQETLPDEQRLRFARNVQNQSARLTEMIDKLLALAAVEQAGWLQQREPVSVAALFEQVAESSRPSMQAAGVELVVTPGAAGWTVSGDPFLLRQALCNLVDNACAFASRGETVELDADIEAGGVRITVADHGAGIPDFALERIFDRFYSLPRPGSGERSSGLGLPFVLQVASLHGGSIQVRNRQEGGVIATLVVPRLA